MSQCLRCGLCCMVCDMYLDEITDAASNHKAMDKMKWLNLHRCDTQLRTMKDGKKITVLRIPLTCTQLDQEKDGKFKCKIYDTRPELCRKFYCGRAQNTGMSVGNDSQVEHSCTETNSSSKGGI